MLPCKTSAHFLKNVTSYLNITQRNYQNYNKYRMKYHRFHEFIDWGYPYPRIKETPEEELPDGYPEILDLSVPARLRRRRERRYNKVKNLGTIEEKLIQLNMPRYYGWKSYWIREGRLDYDPLPYTQFLTRTHVVPEQHLPQIYENLLSKEDIEKNVTAISRNIQDLLVFEFKYRDQENISLDSKVDIEKAKEKRRSQQVSQGIHRILMSQLSLDYPHLTESQLDLEPRVEAFWFIGGIEPPRTVRITKTIKHWHESVANEPVDRPIQYYGKPMFHLRHEHPLKEIMPMEECKDLDLPEVAKNPELGSVIHPEAEGLFDDYKHATIIPGFWPGDQSEFGFLSYHNRAHLLRRSENYNDIEDALATQAVLGSYSWLYAQACYQGFSTYQDLTYPLVNQGVITNGQIWSFFVYQLNTIANNTDRINENPIRNVCWVTKPMKLFDHIDENNQVHGFNNEVVENLLKFYVNTPTYRVGLELNPYLSSERNIAGISHNEKRNWLEKTFKHLFTDRPRHRRLPEIQHWEYIYKIKHKTRELDKRREPWEFGINRFKRKLDDHTPRYIPKAHRVHPKSRLMFEMMHYPNSKTNWKVEYINRTKGMSDWTYHLRRGYDKKDITVPKIKILENKS